MGCTSSAGAQRLLDEKEESEKDVSKLKQKLQERENARRKTERDANKQFEAEFLEREAEKRAADADFVAATLEVEAVKMAAYKSDEATAAAGNGGASNLDENHQQAIEDSLKLYQETVAARRRRM